MAVALTRWELDAGDPRREATRCRDAKAARRMLHLAPVLHHGEGLAGLRDRPHPGPAPRLTPEQRPSWRGSSSMGRTRSWTGWGAGGGPICGRWSPGASVSSCTSAGIVKVRRRLGVARLSVRPRHPSNQP